MAADKEQGGGLSDVSRKLGTGTKTAMIVTERAGRGSPKLAHAVSANGSPRADAESEDMESPGGEMRETGQNSVDLLPFLDRSVLETEKLTGNYQNFLDYYKKFGVGGGGEKAKGSHRANRHVAEAPSIDLGPMPRSWNLVFQLAERGDGQEKGVPQECVDMAQRLWANGINVECVVDSSGDELHVTIGMSYEIMVEEATAMMPGMRLREMKGSATFKPKKMHHYALDEFANDPKVATVFSSSLRQRLVWNRMKRLTGIDLEERMRYMSREDSMEAIESHIETNHHIRAKLVREVLTGCGAFRNGAEEILGEDIHRLAIAVVAEPFFTVEPEHTLTPREQAIAHAQAESMRQKGLDPISFYDVKAGVERLREWISVEPGQSEKYVGALTMYFPLHHDLELEYLRTHWGSFGLMCIPWIEGKTAEGQGTPCYYEQCGDKFSRHVSMYWTPVDTIRDYFGDQIGLYNSWLVLYTRSMIVPAAFGLITQIGTIVNGIDDNPLVTAYSVFLCLWSALFISFWKRRENELKFLWGSEEAEGREPARPQFVGVMVMNPETQTIDVRAASPWKAAGKIATSTCMTLCILCIVVLSAFLASTIRYHEAPKLCQEHPEFLLQNPILCARCESPYADFEGLNISSNSTANITTVDGAVVYLAAAGHRFTMVPFVNAQLSQASCEELCDPGDPSVGIPPNPACFINPAATNRWDTGYPPDFTAWQKNKYKWTSALLNTVLIQVFSVMYEAIAVGMNDWENHRTQTQYEDQLILKNFVFQFVNNYFILFYIAYMRQIELPFLEVDAECKGGSCLSELSIQVMVVFTTKTIVAQILEIAKPMMRSKLSMLSQKLQLRKMQKQMMDVTHTLEQIVLPEDLEEMLGVDPLTLKRKKAAEKKRAELELRLQKFHAKGDEHPAETESYLVEYPSTFDDFNEMAIQFGYLVLFSPAYPLAPLLAMLNNILEIRVDASKLCNSMRRPQWKQQSDIGTWITVLNVLGFFAIIVNSTMISFVGMRFADDATERLGGFSARTENWQLWLRAVVIEHGMLLLRILILLLFPAAPLWLEGAKDSLNHKIRHLSDLADYEEEQKIRLDFLKRYEVATVEDTTDAALTREPLANVDAPKTPSIGGLVPGKKSKNGKNGKKGKKESQQSLVSDARGDSGISVKVTNPMALDDDMEDED